MFGDEQAHELIEIGLKKGLSNNDIIATITRITSQAIIDHYHRFGPAKKIDEIFMCGGGAYNPNITKHMQEAFPETRITMLDECGIPAGAKEAISFAFEGMDGLLGRPLLVPQRVETRTPSVLGKLTPGQNYRALLRKSVEFSSSIDANQLLPPVKKLVIEQ